MSGDEGKPASDVPGLSEGEALEALEELHHDGDVEVVPGVGSDMDEPGFRLTDSGVESAEEVLRENDDAVLMVVGMHLSRVGKINNSDAVTEALVEIGTHLRDDAGVNIFRVIGRNPDTLPISVDVDGIPDELIEEFDPDQ